MKAVNKTRTRPLFGIAIALLFIASAFSFLANIPSAYALGSTLTASCNDRGQLSLLRNGQYTGEVYAKVPDGDFFKVEGSWSKQGRRMKFISDDMQLVSHIEYTAEIRGYDGGFMGSAKTICPGYQFSCKVASWHLNECKLVGDEYLVRFTAKEVGDVTDLNYIVTDDTGKTYIRSKAINNKELSDFQVVASTQDEYVVTFNTDKVVERFTIAHEFCDTSNEPYFHDESILCNVKRCSSDPDCAVAEYCRSDKGICKPLACDHCAYDHRCFGVHDELPIAGEPYYCSDVDIWERQRQDGQWCSRDEECLGDCVESESTDSAGGKVCETPVVTTTTLENDGALGGLFPSTTESPAAPKSKLLQALQIGGIIFLALSIVLFTIRVPLPALGRRYLEKQQRGEDHVLKQWHDMLTEHVKKQRQKIGL